MKEIKLNVEGMVCSGCENRVKKALMEVNGVESVIADHLKKEVTIITSSDIDTSVLKETIDDLGFEVVE